MSDFFLRIGRFGIFVFALLLGGAIAYVGLQYTFFEPINPQATEKVSFVVTAGDNLKTISRRLEEQGLVRFWWSVYYPGAKQLQKSDTVIKAGEYLLSASEGPQEILKAFLDGKVEYKTLTIPEGFNLEQILRLIAETGLVTYEEAVKATRSRALITQARIPSASLEGYVFPETYKFTRPIDALTILSRMIEEGKKKITENILQRTRELGWTFHEVLTLASIIEKETGVAEERPTISSVFHNRLRVGMPLQSDPTVIYGIPDFNGNLTKKDLRTEHPYNTYLNPGLPPTPICSPGLDSIAAALYPADTDYLYFVSKGDGTHQFSSTLKEHNKAVREYQLKKK